MIYFDNREASKTANRSAAHTAIARRLAEHQRHRYEVRLATERDYAALS